MAQKSRLVGEGGAIDLVTKSSQGYRRYPRDCTDCLQSERYIYPIALSIEYTVGVEGVEYRLFSRARVYKFTGLTDKGRASATLAHLPAPSAADRSPQTQPPGFRVHAVDEIPKRLVVRFR